MGVSHHPSGGQPAAVVSLTPPEVAVEEDGSEERVLLSGTMFHDGLNKNAWGLSEAGAQEIADELVGYDLTAAHPHIRGHRYDRSMAGQQGAPIGTVLETDVASVDSMLDGGGYTAEYVAEVKDPIFKSRYAAGVYDGDGYSVSIGIYGDPESATCSACGEQMASEECSHERFEEVEADDGETTIAGPVYDNAVADHLAAVYRPAYEGSSASVSAEDEAAVLAPRSDDPVAASTIADDGQLVPSAASVLAEPFSASEAADASDEAAEDEAADESTDDAYRVRCAGYVPDEQGDLSVQLKHE